MSSSHDNPTRFFRAILTDPTAAQELLEHHPEHEQVLLIATAAQNAILYGFPTQPKPTQIRTLASSMRKMFTEPIDSYAIAMLIQSVFTPESLETQHRLDALPIDTKRRMSTLLPHAIYSTNHSISNADHWAQEASKYYNDGLKIISNEYGFQLGGFYRMVCTHPLEAARHLKNDATISTEQKLVMAATATATALRHFFPQGPTTAGHQRLLHYLQTNHGDFPTETFDQIIDHIFNPPTETLPFDGPVYAIMILIPSAVSSLTNMTNFGIAEFAKACRTTEKEVGNAIS